MICPNCGSEIKDGLQFCTECGEELLSSLSSEDKASASKRKPAPGAGKRGRKAPPRRKNSWKLYAILAGAVLVVVLIIILALVLNKSPGVRIADDLADKMGRTVALAEKNANIEMSQESDFSVLKTIVDYDYITASTKTVTVEGIRLPEWVVFVECSDEENVNKSDKTSAKIETVSYFDFSVIQHNWKGQHTSEAVDTSKLTAGMSKREAEKQLTLTPVSTTYGSDDTVSYHYKYYFVDADSKDELAYSLSVKFDADGNITAVENKQRDYIALLLS